MKQEPHLRHVLCEVEVGAQQAADDVLAAQPVGHLLWRPPVLSQATTVKG